MLWMYESQNLLDTLLKQKYSLQFLLILLMNATHTACKMINFYAVIEIICKISVT
jgi:hypothetical protein